MKNDLIWASFVFTLVLTALLYNFNRHKTPLYTDANCIRAMVGEYNESDPVGLKLMAHAIRNRKTLKGVYGYYNKNVYKTPKEIWITATLAWHNSKREMDPLNGASEWRSYDDLRRQRFPRNLKPVYRYKTTFFYKPTQ
jgi:hypothetical protein